MPLVRVLFSQNRHHEHEAVINSEGFRQYEYIFPPLVFYSNICRSCRPQIGDVSGDASGFTVGGVENVSGGIQSGTEPEGQVRRMKTTV